MDWNAILRACRETALGLGLSAADADDVGAEAVLRTLEAMPEQAMAHAKRSAHRLAVDLLSGRGRRGLTVAAAVTGVEAEQAGECVDVEGLLDARRELARMAEVARPGWVASAVDGEGSARRMGRKRVRDAMRSR